MLKGHWTLVLLSLAGLPAAVAAEIPKPYTAPCVEREDVFEFTEKPTVKLASEDRYEISFAVKGRCDVTVGIIDEQGVIVRHLACGVLGPNAPAPFEKNSLRQTLVWNGKDDLDWYPKSPQKLQVRVTLGLKPVFARRLGGTSGHSLPGGPRGLAVDAGGAYVFAGIGGGFDHDTVRKFGRDGEYLGTIFPPPARMPLERSKGMGFVEFAPGMRARHGNDLQDSISGIGGVLRAADGSETSSCQAAVAGNRLVYLGVVPKTVLCWLNTDGSSEVTGLGGIQIGPHGPRGASVLLAASPGGKWVYLASLEHLDPNVVFRMSLDGSQPHVAFLGEARKPGSDNAHLSGAEGIDCDAQGRLYVSDSNNNRIQIFSPEGAHLKTIPVGRPGLLRVHQKTGAIYVQHPVRVEGRSVSRLTKFGSFDQPAEQYHVNGLASALMALDSWSSKPRLWLGGGVREIVREKPVHHSIRIFEEDAGTLKLLRDFDQEVRKEAGGEQVVQWAGDCFDKVVCDPNRERVYYRNSAVFDLRTGADLGRFSPALPCGFDDMSFDKHGYAHLHFNPCFFGQGVGRVDPGRATGDLRYPECPYDYGVEGHGWQGILPTRDQCGAKGFQDGLGVNMRGDVASESNIYYAPKMEDEVRQTALGGNEARLASGVWSEEENSYNRWLRSIDDDRKKGVEVYSIRRVPGIPLWGGTIWTYDRNGELRQDCAVISGNLINGVQMDEDGKLYFVSNRTRLYGGQLFLAGQAGIMGKPGGLNPLTGTLMKTGLKPARVLFAKAAIPLEPLPERPADLAAVWGDPGGGSAWADGMEWLYAGASPVVPSCGGCSCPRQHLGLDWFKRTYLPEAYRHSIGILDTNGNLILHLGQYGNFDDAPGGRDGAQPGGQEIGIQSVRFVSATDNFLVFGDWGERLVVLKLANHAEETVRIRPP